MIGYAAKHYVKNIWYNLISLIILMLTILLSTAFVTNIEKQTKWYNLVKPYLNEYSILIGYTGNIENVPIEKPEKILITKEAVSMCNTFPKFQGVAVYNEVIMEKIKPRLLEGKQIDEIKGNEDIITVLISENGDKYRAGDTLTVTFFAENEMIETDVLIAGVISDGQRIFMKESKEYFDMGYEDLFYMSSNAQTGEVVIITIEEELAKLKKDIYIDDVFGIIKLEDNLSQEERKEIMLDVMDWQVERGYSTGSAIPSSKILAERMESSLNATLMKYIPLMIAMLVLVIMCTVGMVAVKTSNSMKYYGMLYICGMPYQKAAMMTGIEMAINSTLAIVMSLSLITIQNKLNLIGTINCETGMTQSIVMIGFCVITIFVSILMTTVIMKEKTASQILRDTAY